MKKWNDRLNELESSEREYIGNVFGWRFSLISAVLIVLLVILMLWSKQRNERLGIHPVQDSITIVNPVR
ncbi:MAG TPA: hypothetical protein P5275_14645 [Saprospiraceae bacterium]|nr:hypothetical protein [Saprospiraceae bacterium]MCB9268918.1 hypothetical protein [Lewinellaceae bacterium]HPG08214.1 hypothetical protein [Saprospiraceae bacterium]HPQ98590.1 hypothetical protein [Saprospiraceae bacterium]HQU54695.1 hypothetical protein [Saprospiraceae bacterium]